MKTRSRAVMLTPIAILLAMLAATSEALAHHGMDNATPTNAMQGLISGLAHPVIGLDHFAFVVGGGVLAATLAGGVWLPLVFLLASAAGVALHLNGVGLPFGEAGVAISALLLGLAVLSGRRWPTSVAAILFCLAGLFHGHALTESIVGAEAAPLIAYLIGLTIVMLAISYGAFALTRGIEAMAAGRATLMRQGVGALASLAGLAFLARAIAG